MRQKRSSGSFCQGLGPEIFGNGEGLNSEQLWAAFPVASPGISNLDISWMMLLVIAALTEVNTSTISGHGSPTGSDMQSMSNRGSSANNSALGYYAKGSAQY